MGANQQKPTLTAEGIKKIQKDSEFSEKEIREWHGVYRNSCKRNKRFLTVKEFKDVYTKMFGGDAEHFAEHIFRTFDKDGNGKVDFHEFMIGLSVTSSTDNEKKLRWAFNMYDIDGNGSISRSEMLNLMQSVYKMTPTITKPPDVDTPQKMTDKLFRKIDTNGDNELSWDEFKDGAMSDPLVLRLLQLNPDP